MHPKKRRRALIVLDRGPSIPSATVRALQYRPLFEQSPAWEAQFATRVSESLERLVSRTDKPHIPLLVPLVHRPIDIYARRWRRRHEDDIVRMAAAYDLVYVVKVSDLSFYRKLATLKGPKVVMELNDGLWLPFFQTGGWRDLNAMLALSDAVICENDSLADYARRHNGSVHIVPDSPQLPVFDRLRDEVRRDPDKVVIGWIGSRETVGTLYRILEPLEELFARHRNLHLRIVGAESAYLPRFENVRFTCLTAYDQETMAREAFAFDIGVFPLYHNQDASARGALKTMVYMSAEAAVVAERIGENPKLIEDGVNGMLASTSAEWLEKLERLVSNPVERKAIARRGLETIRDKFDAPVVFAKLTAAFDKVMTA